jgi:hypothetical protein
MRASPPSRHPSCRAPIPKALSPDAAAAVLAAESDQERGRALDRPARDLPPC